LILQSRPQFYTKNSQAPFISKKAKVNQMVTLKSVFVDVELSNGYFGFIVLSKNPEPFDSDLQELTTQTEFKNTLELMDVIVPKVSDFVLGKYENVKDITFNMSFDCSVSGRHIMSDSLNAPVYTKI
jgi:hypothetical protein